MVWTGLITFLLYCWGLIETYSAYLDTTSLLKGYQLYSNLFFTARNGLFLSLIHIQLFQYYDSLSEAGIALEVELEEHLHYATDPELWERLLQNMLSNVLKHGKEQARLTLTSDADTIRVELRNIVQQPIQHLDQLASRFYSENLSDTEESSGLGLYIIQNFVEILGGDLQLATEADWFVLTITLREKA